MNSKNWARLWSMKYFHINILFLYRSIIASRIALTNWPGFSATKMAATATAVINTLDSRSRRTVSQRVEDTTMKNACVFWSWYLGKNRNCQKLQNQTNKKLIQPMRRQHKLRDEVRFGVITRFHSFLRCKMSLAVNYKHYWCFMHVYLLFHWPRRPPRDLQITA